MNEGNPSCGRRLEEAGISQTVEARRDYRELILTARGLGDPVAVECRRAPWGIHVDGSGGGATTRPKERASPYWNEIERRRMKKSQSRPIRLYFIRHGETEWSISGQHTGRTDIPLTAHGEEMARRLEPSLRQIAFARVFCSPSLRARQTCEMAGLAPAAEIEPDLEEWDYGDYEGQISADIRKSRPDWDVWRDGCPHGEKPKGVSDRADRLFEKLRDLEGNVALFSHGQFGCVLAARWIGLPAFAGRHFAIYPARFSIFGHETDYPERPVISLLNAGTLAPA
jgi:probable phosphoglycerate mutase